MEGYPSAKRMLILRTCLGEGVMGQSLDGTEGLPDALHNSECAPSIAITCINSYKLGARFALIKVYPTVGL